MILYFFIISSSHNTKRFLNKLHNLFMFLNCPYMGYIIIIVFRDMSDTAEVLRINVSGTLKSPSVYQYCITEIYNILPRTNLYFETLQVVQSLLRSTIVIGNNGSHGGNINLRSGCCHRHQYQYLLKISYEKVLIRKTPDHSRF